MSTQTPPPSSPSCEGDPENARRCYSVLGLLRAATPADIRQAYHTSARSSHPDKPGGSHTAFLAVAKAFEVLSIQKDRAKYDSLLVAESSEDGVLDAPRSGPRIAEQHRFNAAFLCLAMLKAGPCTWPRWIATLGREVLEELLVVAERRDVIRPQEYPDVGAGTEHVKHEYVGSHQADETENVAQPRSVMIKKEATESSAVRVQTPEPDFSSTDNGDVLAHLRAKQQARQKATEMEHASLKPAVSRGVIKDGTPVAIKQEITPLEYSFFMDDADPLIEQESSQSSRAPVLPLERPLKNLQRGIFACEPTSTRATRMYKAKIGMEGMEVMTACLDIDRAICAHIALLRVKDIVKEMVEDGVSFSDAITEAVAAVRAADESEFPLSVSVTFCFAMRLGGNRHWVPVSPCLHDVLAWRAQFCNLADAEASQQQFKEAKDAMVQQAKVAREKRQVTAREQVRFRQELAHDVKAELAQRDSLTRTGAVAPELEELEAQRAKWYLVPVEPKVSLVGRRRAAEERAGEIVSACNGSSKPPTSQDVLEVLRLWGFAQNEGRQNVHPDGKDWVHSDSFGILRRRDGQTAVASGTAGYPKFVNLLGLWLKGRMSGPLPYTTVTINFDYAARRHRDRNNEGPSIIAGFGDFRGGLLRCWPADDGKGNLADLPMDESRLLDIRQPRLFDGNKAHEVEAFEGERYSVVFFTVRSYAKAQLRDIWQMQRMGVEWPNHGSLATVRQKCVDAHQAFVAATSDEWWDELLHAPGGHSAQSQTWKSLA